MRLLLLLVAACAVQHPTVADDVSYTFTRSADGGLAVSLDVTGAPTGTTTLSFGDPWGGVEHAETGVRSVSVDGTRVERAGATWVIHHAPRARLHVAYELAPTALEAPSGSEPFHRPVIQPHVIHVIGTTGILRPDHLANEKREISVRWAIPGWIGVSSHGDRPMVHVTATLDEFRDAVFLASDRLHLMQLAIGTGKLDVAVVNDFGFTDTQLAELAQKVVTAQRGFFKETGPPYFLITAIPLGHHSAQYGGTGLTNSFALFFSPSYADLPDVAWLLGHELFHSWNGRAIQPDAPEELMYWFSEGFTNFYARRLLYRAGLVDLAGYVKNLNEELEAYWLSPVREATNEAIKQGFWKSHDLERLPYQRGDLIALIADRAQGLDALIKVLVAEGHRGATVSIDKLLPRLGPELRPYIVDGKLIALDPELLAPCLTLRMRATARFELGFDLAATQATKLVSGLVPGSRAAAAGIREGDAIQGWSINFGKSEVPVEIQTGGRTITYLPQGAPIDIPVFSVGDAAACPARL